MESIRELRQIIITIFKILDRTDKRKSVLVFFNMLIAAGLETISVSAILPFIMAITSPETLKQNAIIKEIMLIFRIDNDLQLLVLCGSFVALLFVFKNSFLTLCSYNQIKFRYELQEKLSVQMLQSYLKRPYKYFLNVNSSEIIRGLGSDVGCVKDAIETFFGLVSQSLVLIMLCAYLLYSDFWLAIGCFLISMIALGLLTVCLKRRTEKLGKEQREASALTSRYSYEAINAVKDIIVLQRQDKFVRTYKKAYDKARKANIQYALISAIPPKMMETIFMVGIIFIVIFRMQMNVNILDFIPKLSAFAFAGIKIIPALSSISGSINAFYFQKPGIEATYANITEVKEYEKEKQAYAEQILMEQENVDAAMKNFDFLQLENVSWKYDNSPNYVLNGISLKIKKGSSIALIGESGAGKTTLADIILGLFKPITGRVRVDDIDIFSAPKAWSNVISYVQQSVYLMDNSIRNNVAFGIPEEEIDDSLVWHALEQAQLADFVRKLPEQIDTVVGERGVKFSGGQRQRIAIARALYTDPQILVLDEATAALDNETEQAVLESIEALQGMKTLIIIAHRLTTIRKCDYIYEVKNGKAILREKSEILGDSN